MTGKFGLPSLHDGRLVYQRGADLYIHDLRQQTSRQLELTLSSDFTQRQERWLENPLAYMTDVSLGGSDQVAITARSQIAVAASRRTPLAEVATPAERSFGRNAVLSHDGEWVYRV